ncbi:MAG: nickel pincer cofactor biosynthesis protein LarC [Candidatus Nezhaarchaeota archaeon]|nr:nickel pincer cofactor biosynthesis protein LarC [Candidatus Nezhaarchaeota archaeon]
MKILLVDCGVAGVSGDMFLAALVDLAGGVELVERAAKVVSEVLGRRASVSIEEVVRGGVRARRVAVDGEPVGELRASEAVKLAIKCCLGAGGSRRAVSLVEEVFSDLAKAEQRVHGRGEDVELHQLAEVDTFIDVVGSALLLDRGGFLEGNVYATPIPVGRGVVKLPHGVVRGPAPATLELLRAHGHPIAEGWVDEELSTPTGVALVVNVASKVVEHYPAMRIESIGYGAGSKEPPGVINVLRLVSGSLAQPALSKVAVLEAAVDDATGEVIGRALSELMERGALDVYATPSLGKKGRPCLQLKVLAEPGRELELAEELMKRTGTLGVRVRLEPRLVANRCVREEEVEVGGRTWRIRVKEASTPSGEAIGVKPEFSDVEKVALELQLPVREVWRQAYLEVLKRSKASNRKPSSERST